MIRSIALLLLVAPLLPFVAAAQVQVLFSNDAIYRPVVAENGMVSSAEAMSTQAGLQVLKEGGNAIDAAVTVAFTQAVTNPRAGNIGGGGFMIIHLAETGESIAFDYREKAPLAATRDMYLDQEGNVIDGKSRFTHHAVGVPGTVAGLALALEKYGTISLERALQPAIYLAEMGFPAYEDFVTSLKFSFVEGRLKSVPASAKKFYKPDGSYYELGETFRQPDLARSLRMIAAEGPDAFYKGEIAELIVAEMEQGGGLITMEDLARYEPAVREPVMGEYRGYTIASMPPPSSGGVHIIQMLNLLEPYDLSSMGHNTAQTIHLMSEVMKLAYADRSKHLGDSDFAPVPVEGLISEAYAESLRPMINVKAATPSTSIDPGEPVAFAESNETTHFSVVDSMGNAVSNTYTLNFYFGCGITAKGTGIVLNNEMDDFSSKPGVPNAYGLIGGEFNAIEPEKRMLSSMSPTIVSKDGEVFLVTGSPGGSRIITTTMQVILNVIDHGMNPAEADHAVRIHHQWFPDELRTERGLNGDTIRLLEEMGHKVSVNRTMGATHTIMRANGMLYGSADPRRTSGLAAGY